MINSGDHIVTAISEADVPSLYVLTIKTTCPYCISGNRHPIKAIRGNHMGVVYLDICGDLHMERKGTK